jgi:hypothetical protein
MPRRTSKTLDPVQNAYRVVQESIRETETVGPSLISQVMSAMGRKGGKIGGKRRLVTMTPERRKEVAQQAAQTRWKNAKKTKKTM